MLLSPWKEETGVVKLVLKINEHRLKYGDISRFLTLDENTQSWPANYVKIVSKAKK